MSNFWDIVVPLHSVMLLQLLLKGKLLFLSFFTTFFQNELAGVVTTGDV